MAEVKLDLPEEVAEEIARRAVSLGTTPEVWVSAVVQDVVADLPEDRCDSGPDDFICR
jgi:hypothetical protein